LARIGIAPLAEEGHVNATLRLWRELTFCGHEVTYITTEQDEEPFLGRGLPLTIARAWEPETGGGAVYSEIQPRLDLVIVDVILPEDAISAWHDGIDVLNLSTTFPLRYDASLAPITEGITPSGLGGDAARIEAAWEEERQRQLVGERQRKLDLLRRFAVRCNFPMARIDARSAIRVTARFPELVLAPEELDFPRRDGDDLLYAGACVDVERSEADFPWGSLPSDKPIVYAAVGTQIHRYVGRERWLTLVVETARRLPHLHFVIQTGDSLPRAIPSNVVTLARAPQLGMLRRAALMISHGGWNGVKEALAMGVPLVVMPFDKDQPGIAARVAFHGLGHAARWEETAPSELAHLVQKVLADDALSQRVRAVAGRIRAAHANMGAASTIERYLMLGHAGGQERRARP
jgi:MGT family glycosyltransferase